METKTAVAKGTRDSDMLEEMMYAPPFETGRDNLTEVSIQPWMLDKIEKILSPFINQIIEESRPTSSENISSDLQGNLEQWRENIYEGLEELKDMQADDDMGEESFFSTKSEEYNKRSESIDQLTVEKKGLAGLFRNKKKNIKKSDEELYALLSMFFGISPKEAKKLGKKTGIQRLLKQGQKDEITQEKHESKAQKKQLKKLIEYLEEGTPDEVEMDDISTDYQGHFNPDNFRESRDDLHGKLEGEVDQEGRVNDEDHFEPYREFRIPNENGPDYYIDFLGVESIDDILPLFAPKAMESIVDAEKEGDGEDPYEVLANLDDDIPSAQEINGVRDEMTGLPEIDDSASDEDVQKFLLDLSDTDRGTLLKIYRKKKFELIVNQSSSIGNPTIEMAGEQFEEDKEVRDDWEEGQEEEVKEDLEKLYSDAHQLYGEKGAEENLDTDEEGSGWIGNKGEEMTANPDQNQPGYDLEGNATLRTMQNFVAWLKIFPPVGLKWNGTAFVPDSEKPAMSTDSDEDEKLKSDYKEKVENAEKWNENIEEYQNGTERLTGWEIDKEKIDILTNLSLSSINPQKWAERIDYGEGLNWNDKKRDEYRKAGNFKKDKKPSSVVSQDRTSANIVGSHSFGVYRETEETRYPKYDEKTTYEPDPNDPKFLSGIDDDIEGYQSKYGTKNLRNEAGEVKEVINWLINYQVKVSQEQPEE